MNQEITEVPENTKSKNAPSEYFVKESYERGRKEGYIEGYAEALSQLSVHITTMELSLLNIRLGK